MGLSSALGIAISGMQYSQSGLSTVSHNVTNTNTVGYTRQIIQGQSVAYAGFGSGVTISETQRPVDKFLQQRTLTQVAELDYAATRSSYLSSVEGAFSSASTEGSLQDLVGDMFASFNDLANSPADSALRKNAVQTATLLMDTVRGINTDIDTIQGRIDGQMTAELESLNDVLKRIYDLNVEIATQQLSGTTGANTNDLQDQRDLQIEELAKRFKINVTQAQNGSYRVVAENGRTLVTESTYIQFKRTAGGGPFGDIVTQNVLVNGDLNPTEIPFYTDALTSGRIKSLIDFRDETVPDMIAQLDEFTQTFTTELNKIHSRGSAIPPVNSLSSGNFGTLTATTDNLFTGLDASLASDSFHVSVVDAQGNVINTTVGSAGGAIDFPAVGPFSLDDLATLINNDPAVGNTTLGTTLGVTATTGTDAAGNPFIRLQTATAGQYVVLSNASGDVLGLLGMNNMFTGTTSDDIDVKAALKTNPELLAVGRMRATDGGLSTLNNENILAMAQMAETKLNFDAAGGIGAQTLSGANYVGQITSTLAVTINDANNREKFADTLYNQLAELKSSISGVNLNEELSLMLIYQNSFQASARIVNVVNELFDTLISLGR